MCDSRRLDRPAVVSPATSGSDTIMSRKKEFPLPDSTNEKLNRRKMKAIRQCLKILEEDFTESNQKKRDLHHVSKAVSVKAVHDSVEDEDIDLFGFSSAESEELYRQLYIHWQIFPQDSKTTEDIDEALRIAICNLSHLHDAEEMLKYLELKVKHEGDRVAETADKTFDDLIASLLSRKRKLCAELVKSISHYSTGIAKAKEVIEEKKKCLVGVIRIAKELKITPSVRAYCDLAQSIPALPKSPSSPDVIIEEIFEDDLETMNKQEFPTEYHADEQRKKLFKKETPFQHKAGLPSSQEVTVKYVDVGNVATLTLNDIRRIKKEFLSFPEKAIRCKLAHIEPYKGSNEWSREAKERFEEMTEVKFMLCSVVEVLDNNILSTELFDFSAAHGRSFSINCQLVKEDLASFIPGTDRADVDCGDSKEHLKVHLEQENTRLDGCNSETPCAKEDAAAEENNTVSESEQKSCKTYKALLHSGMDELYKSPAIPKAKIFQAVVQYIDRGCIEMVPQCHLYPTTSYTDIPPFCIPCELYKTIPIGNYWQQDAVDCLQELLTNEEVEIHVQELPDNPWGKLSVNLYFGGMSLSSFMAYQKYCVAEDCQDVLKLLLGDIPILPSYTLPPLPIPGDTFPVRVTHLVSPKEVYICFDPSKNLMKQSAAEGDGNCDSEVVSLDEALKWCNKSVESLPLLTHFQREMPCLVEYQDGLWYRGKLLSIEEFDPVKVLVQFVDYGSFSVVPTGRLRHIPYHLLKYPVQAVRALLTGFKPASYDKNVERIPYSPEWSVEALWAMMECVEGKPLSASILAVSPEVTISLYGGDENLVHMKLIEMGLADLDE
ncbi:ring finger protein hypothetical protein [Limosa lapponica baueri]|uniref:Tudor domain-containing protein n=1 Tax=Limosa lapponica baueri TaxID=1758121 RepID=A0A2I0TXY3_LIMLA|nr:ring finger protein hypothetical protein [Limosa lapponica baueri]